MTAPRRQRARPGASAQVATERDGAERDGTGTEEHLCTCCDPRNPLVLRPDLGVTTDGSAEFALCVLHEPEPTVYRNRGDGVYVHVPELFLSPAGEIVDGEGRIIARVTNDGFQRLTTLDDDDDDPSAGGRSDTEPEGEPGPRPRTVHVDLTEDDFYFFFDR